MNGSTSQLLKDFVDKKNIFAVVGVSKNPRKYGHKIYFELKNAGYEVFAINPNTDEILGNKCYTSLYHLPKKPDVVDFVVPPSVTEMILRECKELGITKVWLQPGSESENTIQYCYENGIDVLHGVCVMIEMNK